MIPQYLHQVRLEHPSQKPPSETLLSVYVLLKICLMTNHYQSIQARNLYVIVDCRILRNHKYPSANKGADQSWRKCNSKPWHGMKQSQIRWSWHPGKSCRKIMGSHMGMGANTEALGKQLLCATSLFLAKRQLPIEHHEDINPLVLYSRDSLLVSFWFVAWNWKTKRHTLNSQSLTVGTEYRYIFETIYLTERKNPARNIK